MRRKVGVSVVKKKQDESSQFSKVGKTLEDTKLSFVQETLANFKTTLSEFAAKHKDKIISDPEFRQQFHTMCLSVGVDPLASSKGFWADILGVGDFYFELGVKIIQISVQTRSRNGGIMPLDDLLKSIRKMSKVEVNLEDIKRAIEKLSILGNGYRLMNANSASPMICSVPLEMNMDHEKLFSFAANSNGCITSHQISTQFHWTNDRFLAIMNPLMTEGMVWIDIHDGLTSYYFPSLWKP